MIYGKVIGEPSFLELAEDQGGCAGRVAASYVSEFPDAQSALRCLRAKFRDNAPDWNSFGGPTCDSPVVEPHQAPAPTVQDVVDYYDDLGPDEVEALTIVFNRAYREQYEEMILDSARFAVNGDLFRRLEALKPISRDEYTIAWELMKYTLIRSSVEAGRFTSLVALLQNSVVEDPELRPDREPAPEPAPS